MRLLDWEQAHVGFDNACWWDARGRARGSLAPGLEHSLRIEPPGRSADSRQVVAAGLRWRNSRARVPQWRDFTAISLPHVRNLVRGATSKPRAAGGSSPWLDMYSVGH